MLTLQKLIFIFSTHVFDVGDLVMIDDQVKWTAGILHDRADIDTL